MTAWLHPPRHRPRFRIGTALNAAFLAGALLALVWVGWSTYLALPELAARAVARGAE